MSKNEPVIGQVLTEQNQSHETRIPIFRQLEKLLGLPVISFFTSFNFPVMLENKDADMLEALVQKTNTSKGLALLINSPGGDGLAAERIINICRNYSGTKDFLALVSGKAKSAATMVCFGSSKIYMGQLLNWDPLIHR